MPGPKIGLNPSASPVLLHPVIDAGKPKWMLGEKVRMVGRHRLSINRERDRKVCLEMLRSWTFHSSCSLRPRSSESRNLSAYDRGFAPAGGSDSLPPGHCDLLTLSALSRTKDQYSENVDDCTCLLAGAHSGDHSFEKVSRHRKRPDQFENLVLRGEPGDVRATEPFCLTR